MMCPLEVVGLWKVCCQDVVERWELVGEETLKLKKVFVLVSFAVGLGPVCVHARVCMGTTCVCAYNIMYMYTYDRGCAL